MEGCGGGGVMAEGSANSATTQSMNFPPHCRVYQVNGRSASITCVETDNRLVGVLGDCIIALLARVWDIVIACYC